MSIKIRLGSSSRANINPASASTALSTVWPADSNNMTVRNMLSGLSSTIRILAMSGDHPAPRCGPLDFGNEAGTAEFGFFHDGCHVAIQLGPVLGGDLLGGDHQDGNARRG